MKLSDLSFDLPPQLIAKYPLPHRRDSRLLVLQHKDETPSHKQFPDLVQYLNPGDLLVLNNTKVLPARWFGYKKLTKGKVELLLSRVEPDGTWIVLVKMKGYPTAGTVLVFGSVEATVLERVQAEPGAYRVSFEGDVIDYANTHGVIPLPPYMERESNAEDTIRYQTVFADPAQNRAVAAPTAGLHFDEALLAQLQAKGVHLAYVTLHVGPGTFLPIRTENLDEHQMHAEPWFIPAETAQKITQVKQAGGRIIAVGTTAVRTLESAAFIDGQIQAGSGLTRLFIRPGFSFQCVNGMITNFHLPHTTLLLLVAAAIGADRLMRVYQEAIEKEYRFFSYGDACFFELQEQKSDAI